MDRSTVQHNITTQGIKKTNDVEKITESSLSDEIYDNLRALSLIHPFSDELREVFEKVIDLYITSAMELVLSSYFFSLFRRECS